jgi:hypothetical protein
MRGIREHDDSSTPMDVDLTGKRALIAGNRSGVDAGIATTHTSEGVSVVGIDFHLGSVTTGSIY